ncbi:PD-(D/E)XK nuclease family protein [Patescibacteria group bacterium]|nr:PD-(D/E)XK nuclease family protein [Patescibacteria group bacterium]
MLKELIDKFYMDQSKDRDQVHFYITDAGKCGRAIFFKFKKAPRKNIDPRILRIFDHGNYLHQLIMKALFAAKKLHVVASEVHTPPQEMISGRADAIISLDNELYVLDIKSMNSMIFRNLTAPKEENVSQIQLYLHYFKIKNGILLYIDKDQQELKEFLIEYDPELCQRFIDGFKILQEKIDANVVPVVLSDYPKNWQCNYCQFREICDLTGKEEINWQLFKEKIEGINPI